MEQDKKEAINQRVMQILAVKGITRNALANRLGVYGSTISRQLSGQLSCAFASDILELYPDVSAEWLLRGVGDMYIHDEPHNIAIGDNNNMQLAGNNIKLSVADIELHKMQGKYEELEKRYTDLLNLIKVKLE